MSGPGLEDDEDAALAAEEELEWRRQFESWSTEFGTEYEEWLDSLPEAKCQ